MTSSLIRSGIHPRVIPQEMVKKTAVTQILLNVFANNTFRMLYVPGVNELKGGWVGGWGGLMGVIIMIVGGMDFPNET